MGTMLSTLWQSASGFSSATRDVTNSAPSSGRLVESTISPSAQTGTPFTDFVLARIPNEETQKLFALSFGEHLKRDPDALEIDFDDVYRWLGMDLKASALRLLMREFSTDEYLFNRNVENSGGRPRDVYKISFNQFEELMISAQTSEGKKARKLVLLLKKILQEYIVAEQQQLRANALAEQALETSREAARANALQIQLESLRAQQQHLYCFKLFGNRYKCGIGLDVDRRIRQHKTTCPSGYLVYSVPITCKAMEKLFESVMKEHGAWIRMEEYELTGDESEIKSIFAVFARTEELLNTTPIDQYGALLTLLDTALGTSTIDMPPQAMIDHSDEDLEESNAFAAFAQQFIEPSDQPDAHFTIKQAKLLWPQFQDWLRSQGRSVMPMPAEADFRNALSSVLAAPCHMQARVPGSPLKQRSVFFAFKLRTTARDVEDAIHMSFNDDDAHDTDICEGLTALTV